jgi:hypothetical protein
VRITTFVPLKFKRQEARKVIVHVAATSKAEGEDPTARADPQVVKAIAQGIYWQKLLSTHKASDAAEIARVEGTDRAPVAKVTRLALLAPDVITAIVEGRLPVTLHRLMRQDVPLDWDAQRAALESQ